MRTRIVAVCACAALVGGLLSAGAAQGSSAPELEHSVLYDWGSGYQVGATVSNPTSAAFDNWQLVIEYPQSIGAIWNATILSQDGDTYTIGAPSWDTDLAPGESASFGFIGSPGGSPAAPTSCTLNGVACAVNGTDPEPPPTTAPPTTAPPTTAPPTTTPPTTTPPTTAPPTTAPPTTAPPTTAPPTTAPPTTGGVRVAYENSSDWGTGVTAKITIENNSSSAISGWTLGFDYTGTVGALWNGTLSASGTGHEVTNAPWNGWIAAGSSASFGFNAAYSGAAPSPSACVFNGTACEFDGFIPPPAPPTTAPPTTAPPTTAPPTTAPPTTAPPTTAPPTTTPPTTAPPTTTPPTTAPPTTAPQPGPTGDKHVVGYFTAWGVYGRDYHVADIDASKLTHINYAFANISGGKCVLGDSYADIDKFYPGDSWDAGALRGNFNQLNKLKEQHPHLKTLISVGGWTWSDHFSDVAAGASSRATFVNSCVEFMDTYGFDGIDIDWEYPVGGGEPGNSNRPEDKHNYTLLMQDFRAALDAKEATDGQDYLLTIAAPAGYSKIANLEPAPLAAALDFINVMTYDFHGAWDSATGHNAPMYPTPGDPSNPLQAERFNVDYATRAYLDSGVPPSKLVVGVGFYGRGWGCVTGGTNGLFGTSSCALQGSFEPGSFDYKDLAANYVNRNGYTRYWDTSAQVPFLYKPGGGWISYDDPESIGIKSDYITANNLGGAMFWELSGDNGDLLTTLDSRLNG